MIRRAAGQADDAINETAKAKPMRADAQRNLDALLDVAFKVFTTSGVDAPVREIAEKAGVGVATLYRHFPQRADLIAAALRREIDACANAAPALAAKHEPGAALAKWIERYVAFVATKRGLAKALHSGDPAFEPLPAYFDKRLQPALRTLLEAATAAGEVRADIEPKELLAAVASLCMQSHNEGLASAQRMVALLVDGLRYRANPSPSNPPDMRHRRGHRARRQR